MALTYDARRGVTVLFGGGDSGGPFNDTWERAGSGQWYGLIPSRAPRARQRMASAYFPRLRQVVIFDGIGEQGLLDDTWVWSGQNWRTKSFVPRPDGLDLGMAYDSIMRGLLVFGGSGETWLFR